MYLSILFLPLLGSMVSGLLGRKIGVNGSHLFTSICLIISCILTIIAFYEIIISGSAVTINISNWINSENFYIL
jgi:NADH-ubiquinone oxidoreductase chain 5